MIRSGFRTSEFWTTAASQLLALLALIGLVKSDDVPGLQDAMAKCIAAAFVFAANAWVVIEYVRSRTFLKQAAGPH
ncbi:MAG: hypothetical protein U0746_10625 [Gemmataceae bacterium]